jgi:hypothetical protein
MAYIPNQEDENEKNATQPQAASGGPILSAESGAISAGASNGAPTSGSPGSNKPAGSGFVNLNKYITANEGNDEAMGKAVDGTVGAVAKDAETKATGYADKANTTVQSNIIKDTDNTTGAVTGLAGGNTWSGDNNKFSSLYNASWKGPKTAREAATPEYDTASTAAQNTASTAKLAGSNSGRQTLLRDTYKSPKAYSRGETSLDSFILGGGKKGAESLQGIQDKWGKQNEKFKGVAGLIDQGIQDGIKATDDTRTNFRKAISDTQTALETDVDNAVTQATNANTEADNVNAGFTPEEIAIANSHGLDPASFVAKGGNFGARDFLKNKANSYEKLRELLNGVDPTSKFKYGSDVVTKGGGKASVVDTNRVAGVKELTGLTKGLQNKLQTAQTARNDEVNSLIQGFKNFGFLKNQLGMSAEDLGLAANEISNLDPNQFIDKGTDLSLANVASPEEIAAYNKALEQAAGANAPIKRLAGGQPVAGAKIKNVELRQLIEKLIAPKKEEQRRIQEATALREQAERETIAANAKKAEEDRLAREELDRKNAGGKKLMEKVNAVTEKGVAVGTDLTDAGKQIINTPGNLINTVSDTIQSTQPAQKLNAAGKNLKKGKVKI